MLTILMLQPEHSDHHFFVEIGYGFILALDYFFLLLDGSISIVTPIKKPGNNGASCHVGRYNCARLERGAKQYKGGTKETEKFCAHFSVLPDCCVRVLPAVAGRLVTALVSRCFLLQDGKFACLFAVTLLYVVDFL